MRNHRRFFLAFVAATCYGNAVVADTVKLTNGDTLTGAVTEAEDGTLTLDHPLLGPVRLEKAQVASWDKGAVVPDAEPAPAGPSTPVTPGPAGAPAPPTTPPPPPPPDGFLGTSFLAGWKTQIAVGFTGTSGNSRSQAVNASFKTTREDAEDRWLIEASYYLNHDGGARSENEFKSRITKDWLIVDSPWFYFAEGRYEYDEFEEWESRASAFGGMGYTFAKNERLEINGRLGLGATKEFGGQRELTPEALLGATLVRYKITDNQTLQGSATLFPALDDLGEYRLLTSLEYQVKINEADGMSLKLGIENEYESDVEDDESHNDLKYYGALVYEF